MAEKFGLLAILGFSCTISFATILSSFFQKTRFGYIAASLTASLLIVTLSIFFGSSIGQGSLFEFFNVSIRQEKLNLIGLVAGGLLGLIGGYAISQANGSLSTKGAACFCLTSALLAFILILLKQQSPTVLLGESTDGNTLQVETIATLANEPISICLSDEGDVFVSFESFRDGRENSGISRFRKKESGEWENRESLTDGLFARVNGMAYKEGALYISRSGRLVEASPEKLSHLDTGVVTRCIDTDQDGRFDYFEDIIKDLPGFQIPDSQHSNNGVSFDKKGSLYVGVGTPTNRSVQINPLEGTILKCDPPAYNPTVYAPGFRNPFGMVINTNDELFITDNDTNNNRGDEVNLVYASHHYGHPYVLPGDPLNEPSEFTQPLWVGGPTSNIVGIAHLGSENTPPMYHDSLLVTDLGNNLIYQLKLKREESKVSIDEVRQFAKIPRPVGLAYDNKGALFVISRRPDNKLYKITLKNPK